ncbi:neuromedin U [Myxosarcina sp. GI1(2024)]
MLNSLVAPAIANEAVQSEQKKHSILFWQDLNSVASVAKLPQFLTDTKEYSIDHSSTLILVQPEKDLPKHNAPINTNAEALLPVALKTNSDILSESIYQRQTPEAIAQSNPDVDEDNGGGDTDLRSQSQNPVANLISLPFQNNTDFGVGEFDRTRNTLNIQPVIPFSLNDNLLLISRVILPVVYQPQLTSGGDDAFGLGDLNPTFFFSPKNSSNITWGVGPTFVIPTATDDILGTGKWSIGPSAVVVVTRENMVFGGLTNQVFSFAGDSDREDVSQFLLQPFFNYNLPNGWYLVSAPIITANWEASSDDTWTVPIGGGSAEFFLLASNQLTPLFKVTGMLLNPMEVLIGLCELNCNSCSLSE